MWIDASIAASFVANPNDSTVADQVGFALAPNKEGVDKKANWLWAWALAIPAGTQKEAEAKQFIEWASHHKRSYGSRRLQKSHRVSTEGGHCRPLT